MVFSLVEWRITKYPTNGQLFTDELKKRALPNDGFTVDLGTFTAPVVDLDLFALVVSRTLVVTDFV